MTRRLPDTASVAHGSEDARLYAPAAERNAGPLCDLLARSIDYPNELPIGVVTAVIGSPAFLILLLRRPLAR